MITQCEIRKLYARKDEPGVSEAIEAAKSCERRRCGHHPDEYPEPQSTMDCLLSVVDPKDKAENKHRYVVASQSQEVRRMLRGVRGVPLIYIRRSVMILEPMSDESAQTRAREERSKFRAEIKSALGKRKREEKEDPRRGVEDNLQPAQVGGGHGEMAGDADMAGKPKSKKKRGPKGPNPLSVKKATKKKQGDTPPSQPTPRAEAPAESPAESPADAPAGAPSKRKRRRKNKSSAEAADGGVNLAQAADTKCDLS